MNYREAQLRNELKKLQERNNLLSMVSVDVQNYLDLEQENKDKEYEITSLQQEIKSHEEVLKGLVELWKHVEELQEAIAKRDKAVNDFLTKHKAKNYGEVSEKIEDLSKDNQAQATKLSQTEKTRKDGEKAFEEIVKLVNKTKTVI